MRQLSDLDQAEYNAIVQEIVELVEKRMAEPESVLDMVEREYGCRGIEVTE